MNIAEIIAAGIPVRKESNQPTKINLDEDMARALSLAYRNGEDEDEEVIELSTPDAIKEFFQDLDGLINWNPSSFSDTPVAQELFFKLLEVYGVVFNTKENK